MTKRQRATRPHSTCEDKSEAECQTQIGRDGEVTPHQTRSKRANDGGMAADTGTEAQSVKLKGAG